MESVNISRPELGVGVGKILNRLRSPGNIQKAFANVIKAGKKTTLNRGIGKVLQEKEQRKTSVNTFLEPLTPTELNNCMKKLKKKKSLDQMRCC